VITSYQCQGGNPLHLSAIAAGVELPALLQLIHEWCQAIQVVQFDMHTFLPLHKLSCSKMPTLKPNQT
jgi:hypothetical protein